MNEQPLSLTRRAAGNWAAPAPRVQPLRRAALPSTAPLPPHLRASQSIGSGLGAAPRTSAGQRVDSLKAKTATAEHLAPGEQHLKCELDRYFNFIRCMSIFSGRGCPNS